MFSNRNTPILTSVLFCLSVMTGASLAAEPPDLVNYQGVLRGADSAPLEAACRGECGGAASRWNPCEMVALPCTWRRARCPD